MKKTIFFSLLLAFSSTLSKAQMDDKFYQPDKKMQKLEFKKVENLSLPVENDTITAIVLKPESNSVKKTILFFHGANGNVHPEEGFLPENPAEISLRLPANAERIFQKAGRV